MGNTIEIYCDGGSRGNPGPAASAAVITSDGSILKSLSKHLGVTTNNIAEYSAVILAYQWLIENKEEVKDKEIRFILDSELVVRQLTGRYKVKKDYLKLLNERIKDYEKEFREVKYQHVLRHKNETADSLVNETLDRGE
jgi:ribonuclease HI